MRSTTEWMLWSERIAITLCAIIGLPFVFAGEWVRSIGLKFLRYNDIVIVGVILLLTAIVLCYRIILRAKHVLN